MQKPEKFSTKSEDFRKYAAEAMRWSWRAETEQEKAAFVDLARTWIAAAHHLEVAERVAAV